MVYEESSMDCCSCDIHGERVEIMRNPPFNLVGTLGIEKVMKK